MQRSADIQYLTAAPGGPGVVIDTLQVLGTAAQGILALVVVGVALCTRTR